MATIQFQPQSSENILYRASSNHKWYVITWKIVSGLVGTAILTFLFFTWFAIPAENHLISFLPVWAASFLTKFFYLGLIPLLVLAWVVEDITCAFIGEFILTDQQIWVRGSPYAWSHKVIPLDDIVSITW